LEIEFPIEFLVRGTPVSQQADRAASREQWKARVKTASSTVLPQPHFASQDRLSVTLYYFPSERMAGDIDNIVKLVLDACSRHVYVDDSQIERLVVQKFEPQSVFAFNQPTAKLTEALSAEKPILYVRISNDPFEDLS
jgi:Holliday junction resolvase RusA-like endonuclease